MDMAMQNKQTMNFKDFVDYIKDHIFDQSPEKKDGYKIAVNEVKKNNGLVLNGMTIMEENTNIAPTIYMESFYDEFKNGKSMESCIGDILKVYEQNKIDERIGIDFFTDFEKVQDKLSLKLVNAEKNAEMLKDMPHFECGDLSAYFQVLLQTTEFGNASISIHENHMQSWGVTPDVLMEKAMANMETLTPLKIQSMEDIMMEMMGSGELPENFIDADEIRPGMYVISNDAKVNGAVAILNTEVLVNFAEAAGTGLYILPSSIHECILLPDDGTLDLMALKDMVKEVNETQVSMEERLSDNVYFFDKDEKQLMIAETKEPMQLKEVKNQMDVHKETSKKESIQGKLKDLKENPPKKLDAPEKAIKQEAKKHEVSRE
ncbi:MAG: DUF5688 family protein [Mobilitalea sp.]